MAGLGNKKSIKLFLTVIIVIITILIFAAQTGYSILNFRNNIVSEINSKLDFQAGEESEKLFSKIMEVGKFTEIQAYNVSTLGYSDYEKLLAVAKSYVEKNDLACGSGIWLEPYLYNAQTKYFGPYMYKENGQVDLTWVYSNADYDYFQYDWYKMGLNTKDNIAWTEPYLDEVTGTIMITSASPIKVGDKVIGVVTTDIGLNSLRDYVKNIKVGESGFAFIVTKDGYYLASRDEEKDLKQKITEEKDENLKLVGEKIKQTERGVFQANFEGENCFLAFSAIGNTGLKLVEVFPQKEAFASLNRTLIINSLILVIAIFAFVLLLVFILQRRVINPLNLMMADAQKVAAGDFSFIDELSGEEEQNTQNELELLKQAFKAMVRNLRDLTLKIKEAALSVADSSKQIANSAEQSAKAVEQIAITINELADGASRQAQLSQDGSEMVSQTISQLENTLNDIELLETSTKDAIESVEVGLKKVVDQKQKMTESKERTFSLGKTVLELGNRSQKIGEIVEVIVGIAEQTNLLALNAAIEAARAGESGKGFAVVADEVRKLAEESSKATEEIKGIIGQIQSGINKASEEMEKTIKNVEEEEIAAESTSQAFEQIKMAIDEASQKTKKVAEAALMLSENAQELKIEMEQINSIAQDNAAATEEVAAATEEQTASSEEISGEAAELAKLARKFEEEVSNFKY